jgi:diguanylate cyclase (GGDEF)-like protein
VAHKQDSLGQLKRRTYAVIIFVGIVGSASAWLTNELTGTISPLTRGIFVAITAFLAAQVWLLRGKRVTVRLVEESIYVVTGAVLLCVLVYALYLDPPPPLPQVSLFSLYLWFPLIYVFIFLAYESRAALIRSGLLYLLALCISLPHVLVTPGSEGSLKGFNSLGQSYISTASIIAVLFFLTKMKNQLRETQAVVERMTTLAQTDPLTGISNRRRIELSLDEEMERASRYGLPLSLIVFDLNDFKQLNDTHGHDAGDSVLVEVSRLIKPCLRTNDRFGRWGGEEFIILAVGTPVTSTRQLADRIRTSIESHDFGPAQQRLSASFGVAPYHGGDSRTTFTKRADVALYRAKEGGKNRVEVATSLA